MAGLAAISHIVVLMLENRSFDHMLGYLSLEKDRTDINGLTGSEQNSYNGMTYTPHHASVTAFSPDPYHDWTNVAAQLRHSNSGFVENFALLDPTHPERIMGYHNDREVKAFETLAQEFCVCDSWFASVPGPTQPNRFYAIAGTSDGQKDNATGMPILRRGVQTIFHVLNNYSVTWKYYSHDIAFLRAHEDFRTTVGPIDKFSRFIEAALRGTLPAVSWIDPDFGTVPFPLSWSDANDDHPDHDLREGQKLVQAAYNALRSGPAWEQTLLIIVYDEHGGFYDHVEPPSAPDDDPQFQQYGVRVPAFIVSPWVAKRSVGKKVYDHTSIIKTILKRFCVDSTGNVPLMGRRRVDAASDFEAVLTESSARKNTPRTLSLPQGWARRATRRRKRTPVRPSELQASMMKLRELCEREGVKTDQL